MFVTEIDPAEALELLTAKQVEVLDLLLQHKTTKQIARELSIAPNTVDARIAAVRDKWGTRDRKATARVYAQLLQTCEKSPCGFSPVANDLFDHHELFRDLPASPLFAVSDAQGFGHWPARSERRTVLETLDAHFGKIGRVVAVLGLAMILAVILVASLAIADVLGNLV